MGASLQAYGGAIAFLCTQVVLATRTRRLLSLPLLGACVLLIGAATAVLTGVGIFAGHVGDGTYDLRAGDPAGDYFHWDESAAQLYISVRTAETRAIQACETNWTEALADLKPLGAPRPFDFATLKGQARALAGAPYQPFAGTLPPANGSGPSLACAVIVKRVDAKTRSKTSINELLRD